MAITATENLIGFHTAEEAFERRGFVKGVRRAQEEVNNLYNFTHGTRQNETQNQVSGSGTESVRNGYSIPSGSGKTERGQYKLGGKQQPEPVTANALDAKQPDGSVY